MNRAFSILVVEDDEGIRGGIATGLRLDGFQVTEADDLASANECLRSQPPDLVLLDVMLPDGNGLTLLAKLRRDGSTAPVIMLTARGTEEDRVLGFEYGCDDYVIKPFSLKELRLRIQALLRRAGGEVQETSPGPPPVNRIGAAVLDLRAYKITLDGVEHTLSPREKEMLEYLLAHPGEVLTREDFLREVWGYDRFPATRTVDMHIRKLREKLEPHPEQPQHLKTIHGAGYRLDL